MTTSTLATPTAPAHRASSPILVAARMQLINRSTLIWVPLIVIAASFAVSWMIFALIASATGGPLSHGTSVNGASQAMIWYFLALGISTLMLSFPFSQAMSLSRRAFFLGTTLTIAVAAAAIATLYMVLTVPELATNGWGVGSYMFAVPWVTDHGWFSGWLFYFAAMMLLFVLGFLFATIYRRFGALVITIVLVGLALVIVGAIALITWQAWWPHVGSWIATLSPLSTALGMLAVTVVGGGFAYALLRRATA